jgi:hypothetical protein
MLRQQHHRKNISGTTPMKMIRWSTAWHFQRAKSVHITGNNYFAAIFEPFRQRTNTQAQCPFRNPSAAPFVKPSKGWQFTNLPPPVNSINDLTQFYCRIIAGKMPGVYFATGCAGKLGSIGRHTSPKLSIHGDRRGIESLRFSQSVAVLVVPTEM